MPFADAACDIAQRAFGGVGPRAHKAGGREGKKKPPRPTASPAENDHPADAGDGTHGRDVLSRLSPLTHAPLQRVVALIDAVLLGAAVAGPHTAALLTLRTALVRNPVSIPFSHPLSTVPRSVVLPCSSPVFAPGLLPWAALRPTCHEAIAGCLHPNGPFATVPRSALCTLVRTIVHVHHGTVHGDSTGPARRVCATHGVDPRAGLLPEPSASLAPQDLRDECAHAGGQLACGRVLARTALAWARAGDVADAVRLIAAVPCGRGGGESGSGESGSGESGSGESGSGECGSGSDGAGAPVAATAAATTAADDVLGGGSPLVATLAIMCAQREQLSGLETLARSHPRCATPATLRRAMEVIHTTNPKLAVRWLPKLGLSFDDFPDIRQTHVRSVIRALLMRSQYDAVRTVVAEEEPDAPGGPLAMYVADLLRRTDPRLEPLAAAIASRAVDHDIPPESMIPHEIVAKRGRASQAPPKVTDGNGNRTRKRSVGHAGGPIDGGDAVAVDGNNDDDNDETNNNNNTKNNSNNDNDSDDDNDDASPDGAQTAEGPSFFRLPADVEVVTVDGVESVARARHALLEALPAWSVVGVDAEWRPDHIGGRSNLCRDGSRPVSLVQIGDGRTVFLIDMLAGSSTCSKSKIQSKSKNNSNSNSKSKSQSQSNINKDSNISGDSREQEEQHQEKKEGEEEEEEPLALAPAIRALVRDVLTRRNLIKAGFGLDGDASRLAASFPDDNFGGALACWVDLLQPEHNPNAAEGGGGGLSGATRRITGHALDKRCQMSNWERRPLFESQRHYAACDAHVAVLIVAAVHGAAPGSVPRQLLKDPEGLVPAPNRATASSGKRKAAAKARRPDQNPTNAADAAGTDAAGTDAAGTTAAATPSTSGNPDGVPLHAEAQGPDSGGLLQGRREEAVQAFASAVRTGQQPPRFLVERNLVRVAHSLRGVGFDAKVLGNDDESGANVLRALDDMAEELRTTPTRRIVVARNVQLVARCDAAGLPVHVPLIQERARTDEIVAALAAELDITASRDEILSRCTLCNHLGYAVVAEAESRRERGDRWRSDVEYRRCGGCLKLFWTGAMHDSAVLRFAGLVDAINNRRLPAPFVKGA
jgi:uncharacterized protein with PIN domain